MRTCGGEVRVRGRQRAASQRLHGFKVTKLEILRMHCFAFKVSHEHDAASARAA